MTHETSAQPATLISDQDIADFHAGTHTHLYRVLGAHPRGDAGTNFAVWAPNAAYVAVVGDFNGWDAGRHPLRLRGASGIWEGLIPDAHPGMNYKYHIDSRVNGYHVQKADPFAARAEFPPRTASIVWDLDYQWRDAAWMAARRDHNRLSAPLSIYEVHLGSWWRKRGEEWRFPTYLELAELLPDYLRDQGFTHVEFMPVMEHPFYASWGYQITGFYAPTSRYGSPQDFMTLIDTLHQAGIGVILDWVPSHFPTDEHGLGYFDGTHLFEHADPRQGFHPDWNTYIFNLGRNEVKAFLLSNAVFWLDHYHVDGLRVDAVASMLFLDYSRKAGEWVPNRYGGRENLDSIEFLKHLNAVVYGEFPDVQTIAEDSSAWPMVTRPTYSGGLGFGLKWDMGWMHDTLLYLTRDPVHRKFHQNELTFRAMYAGSENFVMPLSHDEVVHMKGSLLRKMAGDDWQKFANVRLLFGYMFGQPGKKLLFMGDEIGPWTEWNHDVGLQWNLLDYGPHAGLQRWVRDLNQLYRDLPALHERDCEPDGFEWIDCNDTEQSILLFLRRGTTTETVVAVACNFTPTPRHEYRIGVPYPGDWAIALNSDSTRYWGSGADQSTVRTAQAVPMHGRPFSITLTLPPLGVVFLTGSSRPSGMTPPSDPVLAPAADAAPPPVRPPIERDDQDVIGR